MRKVDDFYTRPSYDGSPNKQDFYSNPDHDDFYSKTNTGSEINMRQELMKMFDGYWPEIAKAQTGLLRRMRRDADNKLIPCSCVDRVTKEPDKDRWCAICYGEGHLWDETEIQFYRELSGLDTTKALRDTFIPPALINMPLIVFYIRYDANITKEDKIVTLSTSVDGEIVEPMKREGIFWIGSAWPYRSDNAKIEFWKAYTHQTDVKWLNAPSYTQV
jgi:hypothetical protein